MTEPVPDPEWLLRRTAPSPHTRSTVPNLSIMKTTIYHTPKRGSPSDHKPNPFVENRADRSGPSLPGLFDISRSKPLATMVEELNLEEELLEEASILLPKILSNTSNSQQPQQNPTSPAPRNNKIMPSTPHMPLALSPSAPRWDGRARNLWTYIRLVEWMLATMEITDKQQKLRWCHKLHLAISPPILRQFSWSQWLQKALEKTFQSIPVMHQSNQYWPRY